MTQNEHAARGPIRAVLFDMDGLMFDTERLSADLWCAAARRRGYNMGYEELYLVRGRNRADGAAATRAVYGPDFPFDEICEEELAALKKLLAQHVPVRRGLTELLAELKRRGLPCAVVSSTDRALVESNLRGAGVDGFFSQLVCGDMVEHSKPQPDIYLLAARTLDVPPAQCMVLEDSYNGVRAGRAAGCFTVMVPDMDPVTDEMRALADVIVPSLCEVAPLLDAVGKA